MFQFVMFSGASILYIALLALLVKKHNRLGRISLALITIFCMILSGVVFFCWAVLNYEGMDSAVALLKNEYPVMVWIVASTVFFFAPIVFLLMADSTSDGQKDEAHWTDRKISVMKEREELFMKKAQEFQNEKKELLDLKKEIEASKSQLKIEQKNIRQLSKSVDVEKLRQQVDSLNKKLSEARNKNVQLQNHKIYSDGFYHYCLSNGMQKDEIEAMKKSFLDAYKQNQKGKQDPDR